MMFDNIDADTDDVPYQRFFDKIRKEREEWLAQDLVVDRREGWRDFVWRQFNFVESPLVPREELPANLQPQNSIRGKIRNYINGVDPRLPPGAAAGVELQEGTNPQATNLEAEDPEKGGADGEGKTREELIEEQIKYFKEQEDKMEAQLEKDRFDADADGIIPEMVERQGHFQQKFKEKYMSDDGDREMVPQLLAQQHQVEPIIKKNDDKPTPNNDEQE